MSPPSPLPELSDEQRTEVLAKAKEAREVRAAVKHRLKLGLLTFDELLAEADTVDHVGRIKTLTALESMPGLGKVRARRLMAEVGIADSRRLRGLGDTQRRRLRDHFAQDSDTGA